MTILGLLALAGGLLMQPGSFAKVAHVEGKVLLLRYGSKVPMPAEMGMSLFPGDQLKTVEGKCVVNFTASGILRMSPGMTVLLPTHQPGDPISVKRMLVGKTVKNFRQLVGLDPNEVFEVRGPRVEDYYDSPPPSLVARRAMEDQQRLAERRVPGEDPVVAEYRQLLLAVLQAEKKPWHTRTEFIANAVKTGEGYRVAYRTFCLIEKGPDAGKDHACYELDTVLDLGAIRKAVTDMKRRLGRQ